MDAMDGPLEMVCEIHRNLREWLESVRKFPDPAGQPPGTLEQISQQLNRVDQAMRDAEPSLVATQAWRDEVAAYGETLRQVRARLANFEVMLQIRRAQSTNARTRIGAISSWADLAKHIG
jgi:DNA repair ATPase RecN